MVATSNEQVAELKEELSICKVALINRMLASRSKQHQIDVPKLEEFEGTRFARDVDNFHLRMEQYFCAIGIEDNTTMPWAKQALRQQDIIELTVAIVEVESFIELGLKKDKFKSSKPKETSDGGGEHEEDGNGNGGNRKPPNGKWKPNNRSKRLVKYVICDGSYMARDYPKKPVVSTIEGDDKLDRPSMRFGLIMCSIEAKKVKENEKQPMKSFLCRGSHRMRDYPEQYKMFAISKKNEAEC
ncbi:hypothetical protein PVK06_019640 [Gossypium arboreum]|uniref:Uncharacterized protein n=1 Tax=Gossypium arboreum TaxID=29729 RepID=A0ABR0PKA5_GOSAR|nr:hypothetical protein PVK06_019640 [Gossypium arboreum]